MLGIHGYAAALHCLSWYTAYQYVLLGENIGVPICVHVHMCTLKHVFIKCFTVLLYPRSLFGQQGILALNSIIEPLLSLGSHRLVGSFIQLMLSPDSIIPTQILEQDVVTYKLLITCIEHTFKN